MTFSKLLYFTMLQTYLVLEKLRTGVTTNSATIIIQIEVSKVFKNCQVEMYYMYNKIGFQPFNVTFTTQ